MKATHALIATIVRLVGFLLMLVAKEAAGQVDHQVQMEKDLRDLRRAERAYQNSPAGRPEQLLKEQNRLLRKQNLYLYGVRDPRVEQAPALTGHRHQATPGLAYL